MVACAKRVEDGEAAEAAGGEAVCEGRDGMSRIGKPKRVLVMVNKSLTVIPLITLSFTFIVLRGLQTLFVAPVRGVIIILP